MSKPILAVFGATGNQGFSVASHVLSTPSLSSKYTVRALSRNTAHPSMTQLASRGAQLAPADLDEASTLGPALKDVEYLFLNTPTPSDYSSARAVESRQVKTVCSAALAAGVRYIIFSSMSAPLNISNGNLTRVQHFDVKAEAELYIRRLPVQSAFFAPASFMQNLLGMMKPRPAQDGSTDEYVLADVLPGHARVPYIDVTESGKWVGAILADPDKYEGKFFAAAEAFYTHDQVAEILTKVTGKMVRHVQLPDHVVKGFFPQAVSEQLFEMFALMRDYGYYGEDQEELVTWAKEQAHGELTGLEAFLRRIEYKLD